MILKAVLYFTAFKLYCYLY